MPTRPAALAEVAKGSQDVPMHLKLLATFWQGRDKIRQELASLQEVKIYSIQKTGT